MHVNHAEQLLTQSLKYLKNNFGFRLMFGIEVEFYLFGYSNKNYGQNLGIPTKILTAEQLSELSILTNTNITRERGGGQYEFRTEPLEDATTIITLVRNTIRIIESFALSHGWIADFSPKPMLIDYGSALHIHVSLHTSNSSNLADNLYARSKNLSLSHPLDGNLLSFSIAGVLSVINQSMYILTNGANTEHLKRFVPGVMVPLNLSWGFNNRTTAIRIPESSIQYRRFEFRVAGSNVDVAYVLLVTVIGTLLGLKSKPILPPPIYGNAYDENYTHIENIIVDPSMIYSRFNLMVTTSNLLNT